MRSNCSFECCRLTVTFGLPHAPWVDPAKPKSQVSEFEFYRQHYRAVNNLLRQGRHFVFKLQEAASMQLHKELGKCGFSLTWRPLKHDNRGRCHKIWFKQNLSGPS